jgi:thiol-disulfide isomerase/thioredoxin
MKKLILRVVSPLLLGGMLLGAVPAFAGTAPKLELKDLSGHGQRLSALHGQIVVLSFWATWCAPCREELPRLSKLSKAYTGKNVRFIAVSIDERKDFAKIEPFLQRQDIHLDVWTGADVDTLARFGLGDIVPGTVILDQEGKVITRITGEAQDADVRLRVDWLLNGRQGAVPEEKLKRY